MAGGIGEKADSIEGLVILGDDVCAASLVINDSVTEKDVVLEHVSKVSWDLFSLIYGAPMEIIRNNYHSFCLLIFFSRLKTATCLLTEHCASCLPVWVVGICGMMENKMLNQLS